MNPRALLVGMRTGAATVETSMEFTQKMKLPLTQQFHFWEYILRIPNTNLKGYKHHYVHSNVIYNSQDLEIAQVSISR